MSDSIAGFIKRERKSAGLTQEEFAIRSGLGLRFIRELEQGKESCRMDKVNQALSMFGCFMFMRLSTLEEHNLFFDDGYFMYCEDFDLIRRIHRVAKTVYYPNVSIVHDHAKASYKSRKMLKAHIKSAIRYFNKWGWLFDSERRMFNKETLAKLNYKAAKKGGK